MGFQVEPPNYSSVVDYQGTPSSGEFPQFTDQNTLAGRTATQFLDALATGVTPTELGYLNGVTSGVQTQLDAKAPTASPTFTGPVTVEDWSQFGVAGAAGVIQNDSGNLSVRGNDTLELKSTAESVDIYTNDVLRLRIGNSGSATLDSTFGASLATALGVGGNTAMCCCAYRSTNFSISTTPTAIGFNNNLTITDATIHSDSTNNTRFVVPTGGAGKWRFRLVCPGSGGAVYMNCEGYVNGVKVTGCELGVYTSGYASPNGDWILDLDDGDFFEFYLSLSTGSGTIWSSGLSGNNGGYSHAIAQRIGD